jgi:hypothetical protein
VQKALRRKARIGRLQKKEMNMVSDEVGEAGRGYTMQI